MDIGVVINQYEIVEHIGRGGMADVWSARDRKLNRMVAIKTIAHGMSQDADPVGMFKQEAQTIAQMEHPHILPIYDFGEYETQLYIVMRYVAGGSLDDLLRRGPVTVNDALRMGQAIAQALDYAHANKIVHLDLKPPNVLLDSHQSPYLADFGLATVLDPEGKATNPGSGTLLYMAPEQLTSDVIDYRADLYSFAIVMFHMLTGQLPFEGSVPLALKQMQFMGELPPLESVNASLPSSFTEILRHATAVEPDDRPETLSDIVEQLQSSYLEATGVISSALPTVEKTEAEPEPMDMAALEGLSGELLEAVDIYTRARHHWAGGNGRFLLGVTNYMVMNGYYMAADENGLELDEAGQQMLLRGALEYDHAIDFWWRRLNDDNRRWVCLHALRSGNAPARVRALQRLETLADAEKPIIPKLVAQMLQVETNEEVRIAALRVFGTRHQLTQGSPEYDLKTEYRGRLLNTITRTEITETIPVDWREIVYSPEIDLLLAEIALDTGMPRVSEFAGRIIGRIRSISAVRHIANQQREGRKGALRALAFVRDEAPSLPDVVGLNGRFYAWLNNTFRRMWSDPLALVLRFTTALIGAGIAMGAHIWLTFISPQFFTPQRWINTLAVGLLFGFAVAILVVIVGEFSSRLHGFWPRWVRGILAVAFGTFWGAVIWYQYTWGYLQSLPVDWHVVTFGGLGLMAGFVLTALFNLRSYIAIPLTAICVYLPINITYFVGLLYQDVGPFTYVYDPSPNIFEFSHAVLPYSWQDQSQVYTIGVAFALLIALGGHFMGLLADVREFFGYLRRKYIVRVPATASTVPPVVETAPLPVSDAVIASTRTIAEQRIADVTERDPARMMKNETDKTPMTELDVNQGRIIDSPGQKTELDVSLGKGHDVEDQTARRVNIRTGLRIEDIRKDDDDQPKN